MTSSAVLKELKDKSKGPTRKNTLLKQPLFTRMAEGGDISVQLTEVSDTVDELKGRASLSIKISLAC